MNVLILNSVNVLILLNELSFRTKLGRVVRHNFAGHNRAYLFSISDFITKN